MKTKFFKGIAKDYQGVRDYEYPKLEENKDKVRHLIDLIMTRQGTWYYMWSHSQVKGILQADARKELLSRGESYKIVESISGKILKEESSK